MGARMLSMAVVPTSKVARMIDMTTPSQTVIWKTKRQWVFQIERAAHKREEWVANRPWSSKGPRSEAAKVYGIWAFVLCVAAQASLATLGVDLPKLPWTGPELNLLLPVFAALGTFIGVKVFSAAQTTYDDFIYGSLANYSPVDKEAYRDLQESTRENGSIDFQHLYRWVHQERRAIAEAAGEQKARSAFVDKQV